ATDDGEVLGEGETGTAVDATGACDHAVTGNALRVHSEIAALVDDEAVHLGERALVEEHLEPLARRLLARLVLTFDALESAAGLGGAIAAGGFFEGVGGGPKGGGPFGPPPPGPSRGLGGPPGEITQLRAFFPTLFCLARAVAFILPPSWLRWGRPCSSCAPSW